MKIAYVNQKGGAGKTAEAFSTVHALIQAGRTIKIIDLDPQKQLMSHLAIDGIESDEAGDFIIIDTPPTARCIAEKEVQEAVATADLIIVASGTSLSEAGVGSETIPLFKYINPNATIKFGFNRVIKGTKSEKNLALYGEKYGLPVMKNYITRRICWESVEEFGFEALDNEAKDEALKFALECVTGVTKKIT